MKRKEQKKEKKRKGGGKKKDGGEEEFQTPLSLVSYVNMALYNICKSLEHRMMVCLVPVNQLDHVRDQCGN